MIRRSPPGAIRVIGHTDSKGDDAYNQTLSEARANRVADWLREQVGVRQRELLVSGQGEAAPIAPNENAAGGDNPAGRAKNRRSEEHTSELQSLMRNSYAVFCLKKKNKTTR